MLLNKLGYKWEGKKELWSECEDLIKQRIWESCNKQLAVKISESKWPDKQGRGLDIEGWMNGTGKLDRIEGRTWGNGSVIRVGQYLGRNRI